MNWKESLKHCYWTINFDIGIFILLILLLRDKNRVWHFMGYWILKQPQKAPGKNHLLKDNDKIGYQYIAYTSTWDSVQLQWLKWWQGTRLIAPAMLARRHAPYAKSTVDTHLDHVVDMFVDGHCIRGLHTRYPVSEYYRLRRRRWLQNGATCRDEFVNWETGILTDSKMHLFDGKVHAY